MLAITEYEDLGDGTTRLTVTWQPHEADATEEATFDAARSGMQGGWDHLLGNMIYLWVFGDDIEEAFGPIRYLAFYLLSGVLAALAFVAFNIHSTVPLVGASGAISGVLAAYLMIRPCARVSVFVLRMVVRIRAFWAVGLWVLMQLFFLVLNDKDDNVAYLAHVGGLGLAHEPGAGLLAAALPEGGRSRGQLPGDERDAPREHERHAAQGETVARPATEIGRAHV